MAKKKADEVQESQEVIEKSIETTVEVPKMYSIGWTDYVLSLLDKTELHSTANGEPAPSADGLARIANLLLGPFKIITREIRVEKDYACIHARVVGKRCGCEYEADGMAEVHKDNTDHPFNLYPAATAETRAVGRAFRKVLGLRKIIVYEEMSRQATNSIPTSMTSQADASPKISDQQIMFVEVMCQTERLNLSVKEVCQLTVPGVESIKNCSHDQALEIIRKLSGWGQDKSTLPSLPTYDKNWRNTFC